MYYIGRAVTIGLFFFVLLFSGGESQAQQVEVSSSLNPVGSGARATGMGGAFIGVADDATAASWNPAGLIQLETPEISAVYSYFDREQRYNSTINPEVVTTNTMDTDGLNYASIVYPFVWLDRNMVISLNYQRLYDMDKNVAFRLNRVNALVDNDLEVANITFDQSGYLYTLSPAMAVQIIPELYIGMTFNFWDNAVERNGWDNTLRDVGTASLTVAGTTYPKIENLIQTQDFAFQGTNAHLGFMWLITDLLTLGGVYKTPFDAELRQSTYFQTETVWPTLSPFPLIQPGKTVSSTEELTMKMPDAYGLGLAYRHSDSWTVAFDVYRTEWSDFLIVDSKGDISNPLDKSTNQLKNTTQVRLGTEYLFIRDNYVIPVRAGVFYDPEPGVGHINDYYGLSLGAGFAWNRLVVDMAYQYRQGNDVLADIPAVSGVNADVEQHGFMFSAILYVE